MKEFDGTEKTQVDDNIDGTAAADCDDRTVDEMNYELKTAANADDDYMPVTRIVSDKEKMKMDELRQNVYSPSPVVEVKTVPADLYSIPMHLTAYAFDVGDISSFPPPKKLKDDTNKLGLRVVCH